MSQIAFSTSIRQGPTFIQNHPKPIFHLSKLHHLPHQYKTNSNSSPISKQNKNDYSLQMGLVDFFSGTKETVTDETTEELKNELMKIIRGKSTGPLPSDKQKERFDEIVKIELFQILIY